MDYKAEIYEKHKGITYIRKADATRACDRVWFTTEQIQEWSGLSSALLCRQIQDLEREKRLERYDGVAMIDVPHENRFFRKKTIYNLNILRQLALVLKTDKLVEITCKFDTLHEVGPDTPQVQSGVPIQLSLF